MRFDQELLASPSCLSMVVSQVFDLEIFSSPPYEIAEPQASSGLLAAAQFQPPHEPGSPAEISWVITVAI